jgi:multidrug resistance efflux pump
VVKTALISAFSVLILLAISVPASAQRRKKTAHAALPRAAAIVSEANAPETPKPVAKPAAAPTANGPTGGYRGSLQDLVALRESELANATAQHEKMVELARDGLVSKKAVDDSTDAIVEARAKLEDAKMRLATFDGTPMTTEPDPNTDLAENATDAAVDDTPIRATTTPQHSIKKTAIVHPRRGRTPSRAKYQ